MCGEIHADTVLFFWPLGMVEEVADLRDAFFNLKTLGTIYS